MNTTQLRSRAPRPVSSWREPLAPPEPDPRDDPGRHRALAVYYGQDGLRQLSRYRRVVVQPGHFHANEVTWLQRQGVKVLAYLSLGEDTDPHAPWRMGEALPTWHTFQVDLRHPAWAQRVRAQVEASARFDGFLLDTLESAGNDAQQKRAMLKLIRQVRAWSGGRYLIANRGFSLLERLRGTVDAVLIESFTTTWQGGYRAYSGHELAYTHALLTAAHRLKLDIYALDYADTPALRRMALRRAAALGVPTFVTNRTLTLPGGFRASTGVPPSAG
ncbi:endo alpha-1,4 polygalactosaminidase [Deinococcus sp. 12RED42]|uniref:endo alpha-1,4 polygalactosaminidase n=1 Tax=Deinococcus sp. 12RED42 TaxID=2745872 RepID=UPI001E56A7AC|nr:endo alpha-1,4 polygalactosaminidase [Deinococcus sp. 12RED42]MCD0165344.1 endo alpha-1,4 polygalactosaminidase [Deinococcus sp. 12RED42]